MKTKKQTNILFIGNSFTYFNDMPQMLKLIGDSEGVDIQVEAIAYPGWSLDLYLDQTSEEGKEVTRTLHNSKWDYVILQEQSSKPHTDKTAFIASVQSFAKPISVTGAKLVLYSTWSYRDGSDTLKEVTGLVYEDFYQSLTSSYTEAAKKVNAIVAPIGSAFYFLHMSHPEIDLLIEDDVHPNVNGSYTAALTFYNVLFDLDANPSYKPKEISKNTLEILKNNVLDTLKRK